MPPRVLNDEQVKWGFKKHCEGYTYEEIAKALFVNISTIQLEFRRADLKRVLPPLSYSPGEDVPRLVKFRKAKVAALDDHQLNWAFYYHWKGYALVDLAKIFNVTDTTMSNTFKKYGLNAKYRKVPKEPLVYEDFSFPNEKVKRKRRIEIAIQE